MQVGDKISTPRFLTVTIEKVLTREEAALLGFTEPTHYRGEYDILGRQVGPNLMEFAAVKKDKHTGRIQAQYTSVWDDGAAVITTPCEISVMTREIINIQCVDVHGVNICTGESVTVAGEQFEVGTEEEYNAGKYKIWRY